MGRRGPKPLPTVLKIERGNPGKRALNADEPELPPPPAAATKAPKELTGLALAEWNLQVDVLIERGVLTAADMYAFRQYCQLVGEVDALERQIAKTKKLTDERLRWSTYLLKLRNRLAQQSAALGLTPSSRSGVKAVKVVTKKDAAAAKRERFFGTSAG
jgi:P27 family predicted phage terminase small subunit